MTPKRMQEVNYYYLTLTGAPPAVYQHRRKFEAAHLLNIENQEPLDKHWCLAPLDQRGGERSSSRSSRADDADRKEQHGSEDSDY